MGAMACVFRTYCTHRTYCTYRTYFNTLMFVTQ